MNTSELPNAYDLQDFFKIYENKSDAKRAIITYAYRNALRAIPALAKVNLKSILGEQKTLYCYNLCRVLFLTQQYLGRKNNINTKNIQYIDFPKITATHESFNDSISVIKSLYRISDILNSKQLMQMRASPKERLVEAQIMKHYGYNPMAEHEDKNYDVSKNAYYSAFYAYNAYRDPKIIEYANKDYKILKNKETLQSQSLWYGKKPYDIERLEESFVTQLNSLDLQFLANDIKCLWENNELPNHAKKYATKFSGTITNDITPNELKSIIFGKITVEKLTATRAILLGAGGAGKTTLARILQQAEYANNVEPTVGVEYQPINLQHFGVTGGKYENLQLYLWDFGGQSIFHSLHHSFLHENCVYVVVVDSRHEQSPDEWLTQIQNIVQGKKVSVLVVTNFYENCKIKQNENRLVRKFANLLDENSFYYFNCHKLYKNNEDIWKNEEKEQVNSLDKQLKEEKEQFESFAKQLAELSVASQHANFSYILEIEKEIQNIANTKAIITYVDVLNIFNKLTTISPSDLNKDKLIQDLIELGFIIPLTRENTNFIIKPEYATNSAYNLLYTLRNDTYTNGIISRTDAITLIGKQEINRIIDFLADRKLCYAIKIDNSISYFFPDASSSNEPKEVNKILFSKLTNNIECCFNLPYIPLGLHARLVSIFYDTKKIKVCIQDIEDIWREGFILSNIDKTIQVIVKYNYHKSYISFIYIGDEIRQAKVVFDNLKKEIFDCFQSNESNKIEYTFTLSLLSANGEYTQLSTKDYFLTLLENSNDYTTLKDNIENIDNNIDKKIIDSQISQLQAFMTAFIALQNKSDNVNEVDTLKNILQKLDEISKTAEIEEKDKNLVQKLKESIRLIPTSIIVGNNAVHLGDWICKNYEVAKTVVTQMINSFIYPS